MKKIAFISLMLITAIVLSSCGKVNTAVFEFSVSPEKIEVDADNDAHLTITVTTTCVSGEYRYKGSSTIIGGIPTIYDESGNKLMNAPKIESDDYSWQEIVEGDVITQTWRFYKTMYGAECYWEPGTYDIRVDYDGYSVVFEDAVIIK